MSPDAVFGMVKVAIRYAVPVATLLIILNGFAPRVGPVRAMSVGLETALPILRPSITRSQRVADVEAFLKMIDALESDQYAVVSGGKGVGECCYEYAISLF